jgi:hypothetical protein
MPLPSGATSSGSRPTQQAGNEPSMPRDSTMLVRGNREEEDPPGPMVSPKVGEQAAPDGDMQLREAGADPQPEDQMVDAAPVPLPEVDPLPNSADLPAPDPLADGAPDLLCPSGSVVLLDEVRYVCGENGFAYDAAMVWLLSRASF